MAKGYMRSEKVKDKKGHTMKFGFPVHKQGKNGTCIHCGKDMPDKSGELKPYRHE